MGERLDQFIDELAAEGEAGKAEFQQRRAWKRAMDHQRYLQQSNDPAAAGSFWDADPTYAPASDMSGEHFVRGGATTTVLPEGFNVVEDLRAFKRSQWVSDLEQAYNQGRGQIPMTMLMNWSPEDLQFIGVMDSLGIDPARLAYTQEYMAYKRALDDQINEEVERRFADQNDSNSLVRDINYTIAAAKDLFVSGDPNQEAAVAQHRSDLQTKEQIKEELWLETTGQRDRIFEEEIGSYLTRMAERYDEIMDPPERWTPEQAENQKKWWLDKVETAARKSLIAGVPVDQALEYEKGTFEQIITGGLGGFGWLVDKGAVGVGGVLWGIDAVLPGSNIGVLSPYDYFVRRHEQANNELIAEMEAATGMPSDELVKQASFTGADVMWEQLAESDPELRNQLLADAGGDEMLAAGLFASALKDAPEVQDQLRQYVEEVQAQEQLMIDDLRESDFRFSHEVLDILAMWGRNVPGRMASGFLEFSTNALSGENYWDDLLHGKFKETWDTIGDEVAKHNFTPSAQLGIDGSFAGLLTDLGMGIAFDPTTWVFGPRFNGGRGNAAAATADAARLARSPMVRQMMDDVAVIARSPGQGMGQVVAAGSWLPSTHLAKILDTVGFVKKGVAKRPWVNRVGGANQPAQEVSVSWLQQLGREVKVGTTKGLGKRDKAKLQRDLEDKVAKMSQGIKDEGFKTPLLLIFDRESRTMALVDGAKRLKIAADEGLGSVPVSVRVVDRVDDIKNGVYRDYMKHEAKAIDDLVPENTAIGKADKTVLSQGREYMRADKLVPLETLMDLPKGWRSEVTAIVEDAILKYGAKPTGATEHAIRASVRGRLRTHLGKFGVTREVRSFFTKMHTTQDFHLVGGRSMDQLIEMATKLWGDDLAKADEWLARLMDFRVRGVAAVRDNSAKLLVLRPRQQGVLSAVEMSRSFGKTIKNLETRLADIKTFGSVDDITKATDELAAAKLNRKQTNEYLMDELGQLEKDAIKVHKDLDKLTNTQELAAIVKEMADDFNRNYIAPRWKEYVDPDTGLVPWERLRRGLGGAERPDRNFGAAPTWVAEDLQSLAAEGINAEKLAKQLNTSLKTPTTVSLPLSPLDMMAASTLTGKQWTKWTQTRLGDAIRRGSHAINNIWVRDKVFRPATAATVSADELMRMMSEGGEAALRRYMADRALFFQGRIQLAIRGGKGSFSKAFGRDGVRSAAELSPRLQRRLHELDQYSMRSRQFERVFYDDNGLNWTQIDPGDPIYRESAKRWTGGMMSNSGFRAFLNGRKAFAEWFFSEDGAAIRNASIAKVEKAFEGAKKGKSGALKPGKVRTVEDAKYGGQVVTGPLLDEIDAVFDGWTNLFDEVILKPAKAKGTYGDVRAAFEDVARQMDEVGGKPIDMPEFVYDNMGPVMGVQKHAPTANPLTRSTDYFFDRFFLDPVNYRRGFVSEMVAKSEKQRLTQLFADQGKRVISDFEFRRTMGWTDNTSLSATGVKRFVQEMAAERGIILESYVDDLVQRAVDSEIDHMLYQAEQGRRIGSAISQGGIFPFAKPYADMAGFWAKQALRKPHYRGWVNEDNFFNLGNIMSAGGKINPRPFAMASRLAHTDFTIDKGWYGEKEGGLLPGSESTDISPLLFVPTGGENPFGTILPGVGWLPMWALDVALIELFDPEKDPVAYQNALDHIGDIIPGVRYSSPSESQSAMQRLVGGGTAGSVLEFINDFNLIVTGKTDNIVGTLTAALGQIDINVDRNRQLSALLADPEVWDELGDLAEASPDQIELVLDSYMEEANRKAGIGDLSENLTRFAVPANNKFSGDLDALRDVWVTAGSTFAGELGNPNYNDASASPEDRKRYADDIRDNFFDLPGWRRDSMIAEMPQLAVNLVSSWEWTPLAIGQNANGSDQPYRTEGSQEGLARHDQLLKRGWIRPLEPIERLRRIVGLQKSARERTAKSIYESQVSVVNDLLWRIVPQETKDKLEVFAQLRGFGDDWDVNNGRELWERWGSLEKHFEEFVAGELGVDPVHGESTRKKDLTQYDKLRASISVPAQIRAWSPSFPGVNPDQLSRKRGGVPLIQITDEARIAAQALGIELDANMTFRGMYDAVQSEVLATKDALWYAVEPAYSQYIGDRSVVSRAGEELLRKFAFTDETSDEFELQVIQFLANEESVRSRFREEPLGIPPSEQLEIQERFKALAYGGVIDTHIETMEDLWKNSYQRIYGPLDWTPPEPRTPWDPDTAPWTSEAQDIELNEGAYQPFIRTVVDGDTLVVNDRGQNTFHRVRLLGVRARDYGIDDEGASADRGRLTEALEQAQENGDRIYLVREPDTFGNVDMFGRELAWLWIGDKPFYFPNELRPDRDPSGGEQ